MYKVILASSGIMPLEVIFIVSLVSAVMFEFKTEPVAFVKYIGNIVTGNVKDTLKLRFVVVFIFPALSYNI